MNNYLCTCTYVWLTILREMHQIWPVGTWLCGVCVCVCVHICTCVCVIHVPVHVYTQHNSIIIINILYLLFPPLSLLCFPDLLDLAGTHSLPAVGHHPVGPKGALGHLRVL